MNENNNNSNNSIIKNDVNSRNDPQYIVNSGINVNKYDANDTNNAGKAMKNSSNNNNNNNGNNNNNNTSSNHMMIVKGDHQNRNPFEKEYITNISQNDPGVTDKNEQKHINNLSMQDPEKIKKSNLTGTFNMNNNNNINNSMNNTNMNNMHNMHNTSMNTNMNTNINNTMNTNMNNSHMNMNNTMHSNLNNNLNNSVTNNMNNTVNNNMNQYNAKEIDHSLYKYTNQNIENFNNASSYPLYMLNKDKNNTNNTSTKYIIDNKINVMQPDFSFNNTINKTDNIIFNEESKKAFPPMNVTNTSSRDIRNNGNTVNNTHPLNMQSSNGETTALNNYSNSKQIMMNLNNNNNNNNHNSNNNNNNNDDSRTDSSVYMQDPKYMQPKDNLSKVKNINEKDMTVLPCATNGNQQNVLQGNPVIPSSVTKKTEKKKDNSVKKSSMSNMNTYNPNVHNMSFNNNLTMNNMIHMDNNLPNKGFMGNQMIPDNPYNMMQSQNLGNNFKNENLKAKYSPKDVTNYTKDFKSLAEIPKGKMKKYNTPYNEYYNKQMEKNLMKNTNLEIDQQKERKFNVPYNNIMEDQFTFLNNTPSGNNMDHMKMGNQSKMNYKIPSMMNYYSNDLGVVGGREFETFKEIEREVEEKKKIKKKERKEEKKKEKKKDLIRSRSKDMWGVEEGQGGINNVSMNLHNAAFTNFGEQGVPISFSNTLDMSGTTYMNQPKLNNQNNMNISNMQMNEPFVGSMGEQRTDVGELIENKKSLMHIHGYASQEEMSGLKSKQNINLHSSNELLFPEKNENEEQVRALSKMFGNVLPNEKEHSQRSNSSPLSNDDVEFFKNMSLDGLLDSLNIHKDILNILKEKINNVNRDITVTICSNPLKTTVENTEPKEVWEPEKLITHFEEFLVWVDNNVIQIRQQLHNVAFCTFLEIYILLMTNNYDRASEFKNKYLDRFSAYDPVRKLLSECVTVSQIFEISIIRFTHKKAKHIVPLTNMGKEVLFHYLSVFSGMTLYGLIISKMTIEEIEEPENNFNFFYAYVTKNFLQNNQLNVPVSWSLPLLYKLKDRTTAEDKKINKEENPYIPSESTDVYCYYKHILKTQSHNRLKVSKKKLPSMLLYCLNNCNDLTCAEISSFDGSYIATAYLNNTIKLWDLKQSQMNKVYDEEMKFLPGKTKNNPHGDGDIMLNEEKQYTQNNFSPIDLSEFNKEGVTKLYGNNHNVHSLSFGETNKILLSGNSKGEIYLYTTINNRNYVKYVGGNTPVWSLDTAPLGLFFCSGEDDGNLRIYSTNKTYPFVTYKNISPINICKYHPNNILVGCGYNDNYLYLYDVRMNSFIKRYKNNYPSNQGITSLSFSRNGRLVSFAGGHSNGINVIDLATDKHLKIQSRSNNVVKQFDSQSKCMYSFGGNAEDNSFEDFKYMHLGTNKSDVQSYEDHILNLDFSYDDKLLVSATCNNIVDFYNCSYVSREEKDTKETKKIKVDKSKNKIISNVKLSKSFGVNYSSIISAKFTPENVLLVFGMNTLIE